MNAEVKPKFNVGGVLLNQPFKIRRFGHFGFTMKRMADGAHFYKDLLGFRLSDVLLEDRSIQTAECPKDYTAFEKARGLFFNFGSDHHSVIFFNDSMFDLQDNLGQRKRKITFNQMSWQVGSIEEVVRAYEWFSQNKENISHKGRDFPGSNWHCYLLNPEYHHNEVFYGMEQIGSLGLTKPFTMHRRTHEPPSLPLTPEFREVDEDIAKGIDIGKGFRDRENMPLKYMVGGSMLGRPFKVVKMGPVSLFVEDMQKVEAWYRDTMGFLVTEEIVYQGHRCVFLRNNTEHHSLGLFPVALRKSLGFREDSIMLSLGLQLGSYQQLKEAVPFLKSHGVAIHELPSELTPGMDRTVLASDPEGHMIQLYWSMEQVGWDGKPRPASQRRTFKEGEWPETVEGNADSYTGEPFYGQWK